MSYNNYLFGNPISNFFHIARFRWLRVAWEVHAKKCNNTLELGCFDGRSYEFLTRKPERYRGLDANWDGGLFEAQDRFSGNGRVDFRISNSVSDFASEYPFDSFICLETMEHISPVDLVNYIAIVADKLDGPAFFSVPNETGAIFIAKNIFKILVRTSRSYSFSDFWNHSIGRTWKVSNPKGGHRGFNYNFFLKQIETYFEIISVEGLPFRRAPLWLNTTIAVVARPRRLQDGQPNHNGSCEADSAG
jgi:hypothetical protein